MAKKLTFNPFTSAFDWVDPGLILSDIDRLTSVTSTAGDTVILTSNGSALALTPSLGIFKLPGSVDSNLFYLDNTNDKVGIRGAPVGDFSVGGAAPTFDVDIAQSLVTTLGLVPQTDNLYNNGTASLRWKEGHYKTMVADKVFVGRETPTTLSSTPQNDYILPGFTVVRLSSSLPVTITGFAAPVSSANILFDIVNVGSNIITITHQDSGSLAANRVITGSTGASVLLASHDTSRMWYDDVDSRWRILK